MNELREIVSLKNVEVRFGEQIILQDASLSVRERDFLGVIGPNGGGKTTLLKVILGMIKPGQGTVRVFDGSAGQRSNMIGYVPQVSLFDRRFPISVWDVALMGRLVHCRAGKYYSADDRRFTREALERMNVYDQKDRQIGTLSEGQKQRVFIARALATQPRLLLLDEPTSSVDTCAQAGLYEVLRELKKDIAIMLVSHDIGVISQYVDKIACLNRRLFYHDAKDITIQDLEEAYQCPIDLVAHSGPQRIMRHHHHHE